MILNYYGIKKLPNGTEINPGSLNAWLIEQDDGYVMNGYLNWQAISRLTSLSISQNKITSFSALVYNRYYNDLHQEIQKNIEGQIPVIIQEIPMHFVVGKNIDGNTVTINDPFFNKNTLFLDKDLVNSVITFTPSTTDLSYLIFLGNDKNNFYLLDEFHKKINESKITGPLTSDTDNTISNSFSILEYPKIKSGRYFLKIHMNKIGFSNIEIFFYNKNGDFLKFNKEILTDEEGTLFTFLYDKNDLSRIRFSKESTLSSVKKDVERLTKLKYVNNKLGKSLMKLLNSVEKDCKSKRKVAMKIKMVIIKETIKNSPSILINRTSKKILLEDLEYLRIY